MRCASRWTVVQDRRLGPPQSESRRLLRSDHRRAGGEDVPPLDADLEGGCSHSITPDVRNAERGRIEFLEVLREDGAALLGGCVVAQSQILRGRNGRFERPWRQRRGAGLDVYAASLVPRPVELLGVLKVGGVIGVTGVAKPHVLEGGIVAEARWPVLLVSERRLGGVADPDVGVPVGDRGWPWEWQEDDRLVVSRRAEERYEDVVEDPPSGLPAVQEEVWVGRRPGLVGDQDCVLEDVERGVGLLPVRLDKDAIPGKG